MSDPTPPASSNECPNDQWCDVHNVFGLHENWQRQTGHGMTDRDLEARIYGLPDHEAVAALVLVARVFPGAVRDILSRIPGKPGSGS